MIVCGLDFETTGLDLEKDLITEVGAVLWEVEKARPVLLYNALVYHEDDGRGGTPGPLTDDIVRLTGITDQDLIDFGDPPASVFLNLSRMFDKAEYIIAHNGKAFDKPLLDSQLKRMKMDFPKREWIDTDCDIPYPETFTTRKLTYLATEHGFINPFSHRAVFDVLTMLRVMSHYRFEDILEYARQPSVELRILVPPPWEDNGAGNAKAKELGFRYDGKTKQWRRSLKENKLESVLSAALPYRVVTVPLA